MRTFGRPAPVPLDNHWGPKAGRPTFDRNRPRRARIRRKSRSLCDFAMTDKSHLFGAWEACECHREIRLVVPSRLDRCSSRSLSGDANSQRCPPRAWTSVPDNLPRRSLFGNAGVRQATPPRKGVSPPHRGGAWWPVGSFGGSSFWAALTCASGGPTIVCAIGMRTARLENNTGAPRQSQGGVPDYEGDLDAGRCLVGASGVGGPSDGYIWWISEGRQWPVQTRKFPPWAPNARVRTKMRALQAPLVLVRNSVRKVMSRSELVQVGGQSAERSKAGLLSPNFGVGGTSSDPTSSLERREVRAIFPASPCCWG